MSTPVELRTYERGASAVFWKTTEKLGGLSNMAAGFPLRVNGVDILTAEALYQACRFPQLPEVQRLIIGQKSPMTAKMKSKPHRSKTRADWDAVRTRVMRWCLRVKLAQNWVTFRDLLLATGDRPIIEESKKDDFWGAFAQDNGTLIGRNVLGRLLMELREELKQPASESLKRVEPIPIPDFKLYGEPIQAVEAWRMPAEPVTDPDLSPSRANVWDIVLEPQAQEVAASPGPNPVPEPAVNNLRATASIPEESAVHGAAKDTTALVRRLIEVDLPIARISAHARREKSIRHGHISTLHIWWARRPLAACRAVICAALWPDPADPHCPPSFREAAARHILAFARRFFPQRITAEKPVLHATASPENLSRWEALAAGTLTLDPAESADWGIVRFCLLDFIADFANWDNSTVPAYLQTSRALTQAAHEALGGERGTRPLVVDPFAGGGSIPLEALRVGADAFASDLNPVAVLLNKVVLEFIPKYGQRLADEVRKWGAWIKEQAEKELAEFYPKDPDGATPVAYLWARTIRCEGTGCGAEVPLMRSLWLANKANHSVALQLVPRPTLKRVDFEIIESAKAKDVGEGMVKRGSATCPVCGFTTPVASVRRQLKERRGGAADARLFCVVTNRPKENGQFFRLPTKKDVAMAGAAAQELKTRREQNQGTLSLVPEEVISLNEIRRISVPIYGVANWGDLFTPRQGLALSTFARFVRDIAEKLKSENGKGMGLAIQVCLAFAIDKCSDYWNTIATWMPRGTVGHAFARQAIPFTLDFVEANPIADFHCAWHEAFEWVAAACERDASANLSVGHASQSSATAQSLPDDVAQVVFTDPPYYDAVPYAFLSDFFYVWLRRSLPQLHSDLLKGHQVPKESEIVVDRPHELSNSKKDGAFYEQALTTAFAEARRVLRPDGVAIIVFASKTTASWEAILQAVVDAGWTITSSWPVDTEREARLAAQGQARLASSVHLICRPRENADGSVLVEIGEWRDILSELPVRMHEWMPRLTSEGVVGADAIFACLGPALEIFSRYARVEKANGDQVLLREYLEHVWAAVSKEALSTIFRGADASGLEPDARLTAMWLWTLGSAKGKADLGNRVIVAIDKAHNRSADVDEKEDADEEQEGTNGKTAKSNRVGFFLEFDAARKIAQGLGIHLEQSGSIVEVKGDTARLLPVVERTTHLFGKDTEAGPLGGKKDKKKVVQPTLFEELEQVEEASGSWKDLKGPPPGTTMLDRLHQAMILFGAQRGELLKRFLVEDGVGKDARFWKLAQSLAALYPPGTDERRWVEGVLTRKKGLGL